MIYCVYIEKFKFVKFGYTKSEDVNKRISELQTGCPYEIIPVFIVEGTLRQEQELHSALTKAFRRCKMQIPPNEWYPGCNFIVKNALNLLTKNSGNINHALHMLDMFDPNLRYRESMKKRSKEFVAVDWPDSGKNKDLKNYKGFIKISK